MVGFIDTADCIQKKEEPFITYYQNTRGGQRMATRLDYIFIDAIHRQYCKHTATQFGNSDHLLVECELQLASSSNKGKFWRFDKNNWNNPLLRAELIEEIQSITNFAKWDLYKCNIQSIARAFRPQPSLEKKIQRLQKKLGKINNKIASEGNTKELIEASERVNIQLQDEVQALSDKWQIKSNAKWIEEGEKSTKFFYSLYKARNGISIKDKIQIPNNNQTNCPTDTLHYIKEIYQEIYKARETDQTATDFLLKISHQ